MINYRILSEEKLIVICNWKETSVEEIEKFSQNLQSDPCFSQSFDTILDNSEHEQPYTSDEMHRLSKPRSDVNFPAGRVAIVAPKDVEFGMSRMHKALSDDQTPHNINVFRDIDSALKWIERDSLNVAAIFEEIKKGIE